MESIKKAASNSTQSIVKQMLSYASAYQNKTKFRKDLVAILEKLPNKFHLKAFNKQCNCCIQSSDSKYLFCGGTVAQPQIKVFKKPLTQIASLKGHTDAVICLAIVRTKDQLLSGSADKTIIVWDILKFRKVAVLKGHQSTINCMIITGGLIYSASSDSTIRIWDLSTLTQQSMLNNHTQAVNVIVKLEQIVFTGSNDGNINVLKKGKFVHSIKAHNGHVSALAVLSQQSKLISGSLNEKKLKLWDIKKFSLIKQKQGIQVSKMNIINKLLFIMKHNSYIIEIMTLDFQVIHFMQSQNGYLTDIRANTKNNGILLSTSQGNALRYQISTNNIIKKFKPHMKNVLSAVFGTKYFFTFGLDRIIKKFQFIGQQQIEKQSIISHTGKINKIILSTDQQYLYSCSADKSIRIFQVQNKMKQKIIDLKEQVKDIYLYQSRLYFCTTTKVGYLDTQSREVHSWKQDQVTKIIKTPECLVLALKNGFILVTKGQNIRGLKGHNKSINCIITNKSFNTLFSCSNDKTIKIWNLAQCKLIYSFNAHNAAVNSLILLEQQKILYSCSHDGTIKEWALQELQCVNTIQLNQGHINSLQYYQGNIWICSQQGFLSTYKQYLPVDEYSHLLKQFLYKLFNNQQIDIENMLLVWYINRNVLVFTGLFYAIMSGKEDFFTRVMELLKYRSMRIASNQFLDPITYCFKEGYQKQAKIMLKYLEKEQFIRIPMKGINQLLISPYPQCKQILWKIMKQYKYPQIKMPMYGQVQQQDTIFSNSEYGIIDKHYISQFEPQIIQGIDDIDDIEQQQDNYAKQIYFYAPSLLFNLEKGSQDVIGFLEGYQNTTSTQLYYCPLKKILEMKWEQSKQFIIKISLIHCTILILTALVLAQFRQIIVLIVATVIGQSLLLLFQLLIVYSAGWKKHLQNSLHSVDIIIPVMTIVTILLQLTKMQELSIWLQFICLVIISLRIIGFLRIVDQLRHFIDMMRLLIIDLIPFTVILIASLVLFSLIDRRLQQDDLVILLGNNFNIIFGEFDTGELSLHGWILYSLKQLYLTITLLNILIAIVSASYDRSTDIKDILDLKERISMILQYEYLSLFFSKYFKKSEPMFLVGFISTEKYEKRVNIVKQVDDQIEVLQKQLDHVISNNKKKANLIILCQQLKKQNDQLQKLL